MVNFSAKRYLISLSVLFLISAASLVYILRGINPYSTGIAAVIVFYLVVFSTALSFFSLFGYAVRVLLTYNSPLYSFALVSLRQGAMIGAFMTTALILQSFRSLTLLSLVLLATSLLLLEIAFLAK